MKVSITETVKIPNGFKQFLKIDIEADIPASQMMSLAKELIKSINENNEEGEK